MQQTSTTSPRSFTFIELESSLQSQAAQVFSFMKALRLTDNPVNANRTHWGEVALSDYLVKCTHDLRQVPEFTKAPEPCIEDP